jgi:MFS family permease
MVPALHNQRPPMTAIIKPITALLMSASIILAANGLEGVLLPLRGAMERFSDIEIGLIGSAYFAGFTLGCLTGPRVIARVGHIRAFTVFTAIAALSPLIEAMWPEPPLWWCFRVVTGICFAGILNVVESWLTSVATNANRGQLMGTYAFINFSSLTLGQQLINLGSPSDFRLFSLVAILCSLAAVPLALTLSPPPAPPLRPRLQLRRIYDVSPAAVAGCLGAGLANGAFWALAPIYARDSGMPDSQVAAFVGLAVMGGALAQWPIGRISDLLDRRLILAGICAEAALIGILLFMLPGVAPWLRLVLAALFGACAFPVYWVSFAHANDLTERDEAVSVSSNLLLLFGLGAIIGPIAAALLKQQLGAGSLFLYTAVIHALVALGVLYRMTRRSPPAPQERAGYDLPMSTTPAVFELALPDASASADEEVEAGRR